MTKFERFVKLIEHRITSHAIQNRGGGTFGCTVLDSAMNVPADCLPDDVGLAASTFFYWHARRSHAEMPNWLPKDFKI